MRCGTNGKDRWGETNRLARDGCFSAPELPCCACPEHPTRERADRPPPKAQPAPGIAQAKGPRRDRGPLESRTGLCAGPHRRSKRSARRVKLSGSATEGGHSGGPDRPAPTPCRGACCWPRTPYPTIRPRPSCRSCHSMLGTAHTERGWLHSPATACPCNTVQAGTGRALPRRRAGRASALPQRGGAVRRVAYGPGDPVGNRCGGCSGGAGSGRHRGAEARTGALHAADQRGRRHYRRSDRAAPCRGPAGPRAQRQP